MESSAAIITLPVSLGEALDKLTILDIKLRKIQDARRQDVQKEYDALFLKLERYVTQYPYHYRILREINQALWDIQDEFHGKNVTPEVAADCARRILLENDRRFRVKLKINRLANSELKEQKGYAVKKALAYNHLGLGDMFWMNGAVRYLATAYDEVMVICKERNAKNVAAMYADDPTIKLLVICDDNELHPWHVKKQWFEENGFTIYGSGLFAEKQPPNIYDLPNSFYDDMSLSREFRRTYFHVPRTEAARDLAARYANTPYIVVHQQASHSKLPIVENLRKKGETRLILDLNENHYRPTDPEYALADHVVNKPVLDYTNLMEAAEEIHMLESSLYCMASHLDLSRVKAKVCYGPWGGNAERLGVFTTGQLPSGLKPA